MRLSPSGVDLSSHDAIRVAMNQGGIQSGALVSVVAAWAIAALAGGWVATRTATRAKLSHAIILGILFLAATIIILLHLPIRSGCGSPESS